MLQGGRQKPQLTDILAYQLLLMPIKLYQVAVLLLRRTTPLPSQIATGKCA